MRAALIPGCPRPHCLVRVMGPLLWAMQTSFRARIAEQRMTVLHAHVAMMSILCLSLRAKPPPGLQLEQQVASSRQC
ncbi:hypothetical protein T440DRAFT_27537 [Plenodomus tracheiphilus IPT5]|uniref:Uncharacterized protein n=1 Tax=Plenodomus tracheiphilus IPT5 TaxID=1408161 RepID=A0A6A7AMA3_9PLEO|nr:hypothetical protein T440DRAFT_27537 [Plenodomus tracheiphilus IPT5]